MTDLNLTNLDAADLNRIERQVLAEAIIGPKGRTFHGEQWERLADHWYKRRIPLADARRVQQRNEERIRGLRPGEL